MTETPSEERSACITLDYAPPKKGLPPWARRSLLVLLLGMPVLVVVAERVLALCSYLEQVSQRFYETFGGLALVGLTLHTLALACWITLGRRPWWWRLALGLDMGAIVWFLTR